MPWLFILLLLIVAENETFGEPVALKILNKHKIRELRMEEKVKREINALKLLQHPHIICLYQVINWRCDYFLVLELAQGGDMLDRLLEQGKVRSDLWPKFPLTYFVWYLCFGHSLANLSQGVFLAN